MPEELLQLPADTDLWEEEHWPVLLGHIEEGNIIPIIGPDLLQVEVNGQVVLLDRYIAGKLAQKYSLPVGEEATLNDVVCTLLQRGKQQVLYSAVHKILAEAHLEPPRALLQLAEISHFNLFVTINFDLLLEEALRRVRKLEPKTIAYSPNNNNDLATEDLRGATVYHLLGKSSSLPYRYVISEEDLLEFVHALQSESRQPHLLFDELKNKSLLILGEHFPDWLARFFLRTAKQGRLSESRGVMEILADSHLQTDKSLVLFLQRFSKNTRIFRDGGPAEFIDQLHRRWRENHPAAVRAMPGQGAMPEDMPPGAVFISYAHEDLPAVLQLRDDLVAQGLEVWFDHAALQSGDRFSYKIRSYIEEQCSCFLMIVSQNTERKLEGYFRREWDLAIERDKGMAHTREFILPIAIDGSDPKTFKTLRPELKKYTITSLVGGKITPELTARIKSVVARFKPS